MLPARLAEADYATREIRTEQYGSLAQRSSIKALMTNLTSIQQWMRQKSGAKKDIIRPSLLANDIDSAFNHVKHERLTDMLTHFLFR